MGSVGIRVFRALPLLGTSMGEAWHFELYTTHKSKHSLCIKGSITNVFISDYYFVFGLLQYGQY